MFQCTLPKTLHTRQLKLATEYTKTFVERCFKKENNPCSILARKQRKLLLNTGIGLGILTGGRHGATSKLQSPRGRICEMSLSSFSSRLHLDRIQTEDLYSFWIPPVVPSSSYCSTWEASTYHYSTEAKCLEIHCGSIQIVGTLQSQCLTTKQRSN